MATTFPISLLLSFWKIYNSEESFLPFYIPFALWSWFYLYCLWKKISFFEWRLPHDIHNIGAVILGLLSLYHDNDMIFNERIGILWNLAYFIVDIIDSVQRLDTAFSIHAVFCLFLGVSNYTTPLLRRLRMDSKAAQCEWSSPFLYLSKATRNPFHFALFAFIFTFCRILWIPYMSWQLLQHGMAYTDIRQIFMVMFYGLNCYWYYKIIRIFIKALKGDLSGKEE